MKSKEISNKTTKSGNGNNKFTELRVGSEQTEQALKQSEVKYYECFHSSKDALFITSINDYFIDVNEAMANLFGYTRNEFFKLRVSDIYVNPEDRQHLIHNLKYNGNRSIAGMETKLRKKNGTEIDCSITANIMLDVSGQIAGFHGSITDITSHKITEYKLAHREIIQRLIMLTSKELLNSSSDGIDAIINKALKNMAEYTGSDASLVFLFSKDKKTMYCSHEWCKEGITSFVSHVEEIPVEHLQIVNETLKGTDAVNLPDISSLTEEWGFLKQAWTAFGLQSVLSIPIIAQGNTLGFIGFVTIRQKKTWADEEIILIKIMGEILAGGLQQKWTEEALKESEMRYRLLIEHSVDGIVLMDQNGKVHEANKKMAEMLGYSPEEMLQLYVFDWNAEHSREELLESLNTIDERGLHCETIHRRKDGTQYDVEISTNAVFIADKKFIYCACHDITERKKVEIAHRESEARFHDLIEQAADSIMVHDFDGNILIANNQTAKIFGISQEKLVTLNLSNLLPDTLTKKHKDKYWGKLKQGEVVMFESISRRNDGTVFPTEVRLSKVNFTEKPAIVAVTRDVTERKKTEDALRESEARFRAIIEQAADAILVHDFDGNILIANDQSSSMFGTTKEKMVKSNLAKLLPEGITRNHRDKYWNKLNNGEVILFETTKQSNGENFSPAEIRLSKIDFSGKPAILAITHDITERKRAEEALRASEIKYRTLFENLQEGIFITDDTGTITFVNDIITRLLNYTTDEMIGKKPFDFVDENYIDEVKKHMRDQKEGRSGHYHVKYKSKDGEPVYFDVNVGPITDYAGLYQGDLVCFNDITERIIAENERVVLLTDLQNVNDKLTQSNKELQDFAYIASHDLQEPMRKISSFGLLLKESLENKLDEDQQENFDFMIDAANRMQTMITDLLSYSRLTTKAKPFTRVDLNEIIANLNKVDLAERLVETGGSIVVPESLPSLYGDPTQIHQLMLNLVNNGLKFHRPDVPPIITIRASIDDTENVRVEVIDNGIGIPQQYHQQIFTMFKRLHSRSEYDGTGIGLAVCSKIVSRHGGKITVSSIQGEGATFIFTLPKGSYAKT